MVFVLQQFDGLILGPKILGESTGVRPLLILFSITVGGAYFGPLGMFLEFRFCYSSIFDRKLGGLSIV